MKTKYLTAFVCFLFLSACKRNIQAEPEAASRSSNDYLATPEFKSLRSMAVRASASELCIDVSLLKPKHQTALGVGDATIQKRRLGREQVRILATYEDKLKPCELQASGKDLPANSFGLIGGSLVARFFCPGVSNWSNCRDLWIGRCVILGVPGARFGSSSSSSCAGSETGGGDL